MASFDWYQATVRAPVGDLMAALRGGLGVRPEWEQAKRAPQGYETAWRLVDADGLVCQVWSGGHHVYPHAVISGEVAHAGAELLRAELPDHSVSRLDPCIDYAEPGAYDRLQALALQVAVDRGIKVGTAGDHLVTMKGRTVYLGATSSVTRLRLYEKAEELRAKFANDPERLAGVPGELARLECQVRPHGPEAKRAASRLDPISVMGSAAWMRELMRLVAGLDIEPWQAERGWRQSDDDRAYAAMLAAYGGLLERRAQAQGWEVMGLQLRDDLAARQLAKRRQAA